MDVAVYRAEHGGYKRSEVTREGLEDIREYAPTLRPQNTIKTVLTAAGYKSGSEVDMMAESWEEVYDFIDTLNDMGVTAAVGTEEIDENVTDDDRIWADMIITRDLRYDDDELRDIWADVDPREKGEFLGYPEEEIEEYENRRGSLFSHIKDVIASEISGESRPEFMNAPELSVRKGDELGIPKDEQDMFASLLTYCMRTTEDAVEEGRKTANTRYRSLEATGEAYGADFTDLVPWGDFEEWYGEEESTTLENVKEEAIEE
ncbi:MAG: hypothetical protein MUP63_02755 [Candidatus Nanohaloarchaeota archaeon QJJ-7]|nr:hypothetical protein [Candidatus Nanohaloarchaeota archaeon QJJ-7]